MLPGVKDGRCVGLTTLPPSCADCFEIWEPQPAGTLRACPGLQWDCFTCHNVIMATYYPVSLNISRIFQLCSVIDIRKEVRLCWTILEDGVRYDHNVT